jgi:hypothetical protein
MLVGVVVPDGELVRGFEQHALVLRQQVLLGLAADAL